VGVLSFKAQLFMLSTAKRYSRTASFFNELGPATKIQSSWKRGWSVRIAIIRSVAATLKWVCAKCGGN